MKLTHPESKQTVDAHEPEPYLSQGWVEKTDKKANGGDPPPAE